MKLLSESSAKIAKTNKGTGYLTAVLFLAPHKESGCMNTCPYADGCEATCLNTSGRLKFDSARAARVRRTEWFKNDRAGFVAQLHKDITVLERKGKRLGKPVAVRLNGLSDLRWERIAPDLFTEHPDVQFYDYTKGLVRYQEWRRTSVFPKNYHLTFSASPSSSRHLSAILRWGGTVAMVFHDVPPGLEMEHGHVPVIDGDTHDARWLDPKGVIVGLKAKGAAVKSSVQFVR